MKKIFDEDATITQLFGANPSYYAQWNFKGHEGIDLIPKSKKLNAPIYAVEGGVIVRDTDDPLGDLPNKNYGRKCVIWNPETRRAWWYCHLTSNDVSAGQTIKEGQFIGLMGDSGNTQGAHLHLGCRLSDANGNAINTDNGYKGFVDPLPFLQTLPVPEVTPLDEQRAIQALKDAFNALPKNDKYSNGNLEGFIRGIVPEHLEYETIKGESNQLRGFISKWVVELHLQTFDGIVQIEAEMAKIMPQEEALQEMRGAIEKAVGTNFNDDSSLLTSLSALGQERIKLTTDLSTCQLKLSKTDLLKAYVIGKWIVKIYANKKSS